MNTLAQITLDNGSEILALLAKVTLLLAIAALAAVCLRQAAASVRHLVWSLALSGSVALAVLTPTAPRIVVAVPVAPVTPSTLSSTVGTTPIYSGLAPSHNSLPAGPIASTLVTGSGSLSQWIDVHATAMLLLVWLAGVLFVLGRCIAGHIAMARLIARGLDGDRNWDSTALHSAIAMGVRRPVRLVVSREVTSPMTSGLRRPVVILPADASGWSRERWRVVLIHELAHVARLDYLTQLIGTIARAVFWFHPGVWFALARLRAEGEHAADDQVLAAGLPGVSYATHLLELARHRIPASLPAAVAVGMARSSHLEGRLRAMLDSTRSRATMSPRRQLAAAVVALFIMIPVAGLRTKLVAAPIHESTAARDVMMPPASSTPEAAASSNVAASIQQQPRSTRNRAARGTDVTRQDDQTQSDSTTEKTVVAKSGERLVIDLRTGGEVILHAADEGEVRLRAELGGRDWRETRVSLVRIDGGVRLQSTFEPETGGGNTSHRFELWVPKHFNVDFSSAGGGLVIHDLDGDLRGSTGGGSIEIDHVSGHSSLSTGGGDIHVTDSDMDGRVSTGGGAVTLSRVRGGLRGASGSGPVIYSVYDTPTGDETVRNADRARGTGARARNAGDRARDAADRTRTTTYSRDSSSSTTSSGTGSSSGDGTGRGYGSRGSGDLGNTRIDGNQIDPDSRVGRLNITRAGGAISLADAPHGGSIHTGGGDVTVNSSHGMLEVTTGGGRITLHNVAGGATASTGAGDVLISVVNTDGTEHTVSVASGTGKVTLELPADLDARVELETAYTDNFGHRTTITSDWRLDREETSEWDDAHGTPRKYVRAHATFGNGRGLIRVQTVNGDVVIRRAAR